MQIDFAIKLVELIFFLISGLFVVTRGDILSFFIDYRSIIGDLGQIIWVNPDNTVSLFETIHDFITLCDCVWEVHGQMWLLSR